MNTIPDADGTVDCYPVSVETRGPSGATNAYVAGSSNGLVIDPAGWDQKLASACEDGVEHAAVTHHHPDHVGGLQQYATEFDLTVWARAGREAAFESATGLSPDRTYYPGESLPAAGGVELLDTSGHAAGHTAFVLPDGIVTGDLAVAEGSVVVGAPEGDMRTYLCSLRRIYARNPDRLLPGHGPPIENPRATCERLIRHRLDREASVLDAIEADHSTAEDIVRAAYGKDLSGVYDLARATVVAHIEKLAVEGAVEWDGRRAVPA